MKNIYYLLIRARDHVGYHFDYATRNIPRHPSDDTTIATARTAAYLAQQAKHRIRNFKNKRN